MITIKFSAVNGRLCGVSLAGHATADADEADGRLVCAAVSSAVYCAVNTIGEIVKADIDVTDKGDLFSVTVKNRLSESQVTLQGLKLHLTELSKQYHDKIKVISEV